MASERRWAGAEIQEKGSFVAKLSNRFVLCLHSLQHACLIQRLKLSNFKMQGYPQK